MGKTNRSHELLDVKIVIKTIFNGLYLKKMKILIMLKFLNKKLKFLIQTIEKKLKGIFFDNSNHLKIFKTKNYLMRINLNHKFFRKGVYARIYSNFQTCPYIVIFLFHNDGNLFIIYLF